MAQKKLLVCTFNEPMTLGEPRRYLPGLVSFFCKSSCDSKLDPFGSVSARALSRSDDLFWEVYEMVVIRQRFAFNDGFLCFIESMRGRGGRAQQAMTQT